MFKLVLKHFVRELALSSLFDTLTRNFPIKTNTLTNDEKLEIVSVLTECISDYPNSIVDSNDIPIIVDMVKDRVDIQNEPITAFVTELIFAVNERNMMEATLPIANSAKYSDSNSYTGRRGL